jgi:hypothetical protein
MKVERPVIYTQVVCDICKKDIKGSYYKVSAVAGENLGFIAPRPDLDMCEKCFERLDPPKQNPEPVMFALSASYAITSSYLPFSDWKKGGN